MSQPIDEAYVEIRAETGGFESELLSSINDTMRRVEEILLRATAGMGDAFNPLTEAAADAGAQVEQSFATSAQEADAALAGVDGDFTAAESGADAAAGQVEAAFASGADAAQGALSGVEGDFSAAESSADMAAGQIEATMASGADAAQGALSGVEGDFSAAESSADQAAGQVEGTFASAADQADAALNAVEGNHDPAIQAADAAAAEIESSFDSAASSAGSAVDDATRWMVIGLGTVVAAAGAAAAAIGGIAVWRGVGRLLDIEDAEAQLRGLGHSAESITNIMQDATDAIEGTIIGLPEAATVAANAVAAGIPPGEELESTLRAVADAATITGAEMGEMGSIFTTVAANNRVTMGEINRLQDRGLPILQFLAEQFGVTADEAAEMVSRGEVDFAAFREAIETNIGGAALEATGTTRGAFDNMMFTLARIGQGLLAEVFPTFREVFVGIAEFLEPIEEAAWAAGEALGAALTAFRDGEGIQGAIAAFSESFDPGDLLSHLSSMFSTALSFVQDNILDIVSMVLDGRELIFDALMNIITAIAGALPDIVPQVVDAIVSMVLTLVDVLVDAVPLVVAGAVQLATGLVEGILTALPLVIDGAVQLIDGLLSVIVQSLPELISGGIMLLSGLVEGIVAALPQVQIALLQLLPTIVLAIIEITPHLITMGMELLLGLVNGFVAALPEMAEAVSNDLIPTFLETVQDRLPEVLLQGSEFLMEFVAGIGDSIDEIANVVTEDIVPAFTAMLDGNPEIIDAGIEVINTLVQTWVDNIVMITEFITETMIPLMVQVIEENLPEIIDAGIEITLAVIDGIAQATPELADAIVNQVIPSMITALLTAVPLMAEAGTTLMLALLRSLWNTWSSQSRGNFNNIRNSISGFFSTAGSWLVGAGRSIINGLIQGIRDRIWAIGSAMADAAQTVRNFWPFSPAREGPLSGSGDPTLAGEKIAEMIADGIDRGTDQVAAATAGLAAAAAPQAPDVFGAQELMRLTTASAVGVPQQPGDPTDGGVRVWPTQPTQRTVIELRGGDESRLGELLLQLLADSIDTRGGDVQAVIGRRRSR